MEIFDHLELLKPLIRFLADVVPPLVETGAPRVLITLEAIHESGPMHGMSDNPVPG